MHSHQTEHALQKLLTASWLDQGLITLDGEAFFLTAWEVMSSFKVNDAHRHWNEPSIDFVFLDRVGRMVLLELKLDVRAPRDAWSVVCQVTHRAHLLSAGYTSSRLERVYVDCHSGRHGRATPSTPVIPLVDAHARAFEQDPLDEIPGLPAGRFVMAKTYGPSFPRILSKFNFGTREQVLADLNQYKSPGEIARYRGLPHPAMFIDPSPIRAVTIDGSVWRRR